MEGRGQGSNGGQREIVYEQPGTEANNSYHNWRVPSKWKRGLTRGAIARGTCICRCMTENCIRVYTGMTEVMNDTSCVYDNDNQNECYLVYNNE